MQRLVKGWRHKPGRHCASTVLSDLSYFYGLNLSEPFCFGLGAGLGFFYLESEQISPSRMILTRAQNLEGNFFHNLGLEFEWKQEEDPEQGWLKVKNWIDQEVPVLLRADIFYLDYYNSKTHFPGHIICLWGYDQEKALAYVADTGYLGLMELPLDSLRKARYGEMPFFNIKGDYFPVLLPPKLDGLEEKMVNAIISQAEDLKQSAPGGFFWSGYSALKETAQRIEQWQSAKDRSWCFRWAYQIIEKRGTGGGAFRKIYGEFLEEISQNYPSLARLIDYQEMQRMGEKWTELSMLLKELSEMEKLDKKVLKKTAQIFSELAEREENFFETSQEKLINLS